MTGNGAAKSTPPCTTRWPTTLISDGWFPRRGQFDKDCALCLDERRLEHERRPDAGAQQAHGHAVEQGAVACPGRLRLLPRPRLPREEATAGDRDGRVLGEVLARHLPSREIDDLAGDGRLLFGLDSGQHDALEFRRLRRARDLRVRDARCAAIRAAIVCLPMAGILRS